jgi:hypothetical protein
MHKPIAHLLACVVFASGAAHLCSAASAATDFQSAMVPFSFVDNRIFVNCMVNGQGPFAFVVDTGAGDLTIDRAVAHRLNLRAENAGSLGGAGSHTATYSTAVIASLDVGTAHASNQQVTILDLSPIRQGIGLPHLDGIIGYSMLRHYAVEVDMDRHVLTLSRDRLAMSPDARAVPFTLASGFIFVPATIAGLPGSILIDTGDRSSLTLFGPFAAQHHMYGRFGGVQDVLTGFGVGGPVYGDVFTLPQLDILGASLTNITTRASRQSGGAFASKIAAASIGGGLLRRFNVVYDYPHHTLYVWKSADYALADGYDRGGLWISVRGDRAYVASLLPSGPASRAGLHQGDDIMAVNGQPIDPSDVLSLRTLFSSSPPGTSITVVSESNGKRSNHEVVLEQLV